MSELLVGLAFGLIFGAMVQRVGFCMVNCLAEIFTKKPARLTAMWLIILIVLVVGFEAARSYLGKEWTAPLRAGGLLNLIGAFLFGFGMMLAGGCAVGSLYKTGEGSVASLLALIGIFLGTFIYLKAIEPSLKGIYAAKKLFLYQALGVESWILSLLAFLIILAIVFFAYMRK